MRRNYKEKLSGEIISRNYDTKLPREIMKRNYELVYYVDQNVRIIGIMANPKITEFSSCYLPIHKQMSP